MQLCVLPPVIREDVPSLVPSGSVLAVHCGHQYWGRNSTLQYSTLQYSTVQYSTVQYSTVQYSTVQYSKAVQYRGQGRLHSLEVCRYYQLGVGGYMKTLHFVYYQCFLV